MKNLIAMTGLQYSNIFQHAINEKILTENVPLDSVGGVKNFNCSWRANTLSKLCHLKSSF